uniref:Uncharacterized protein n=1 Tax=Phaeomonas parva TaxID=124430 RepID=A0A6U4ECN4_9STRA|mmetsp:Transcript_20352/g.61811  ORF Transcript_20352/g.61811 Transcript_20352/m.61811 type:complete len:107 (+) Transcript_20352:208-528(+)
MPLDAPLLVDAVSGAALSAGGNIASIPLEDLAGGTEHVLVVLLERDAGRVLLELPNALPKPKAEPKPEANPNRRAGACTLVASAPTTAVAAKMTRGARRSSPRPLR